MAIWLAELLAWSLAASMWVEMLAESAASEADSNTRLVEVWSAWACRFAVMGARFAGVRGRRVMDLLAGVPGSIASGLAN